MCKSECGFHCSVWKLLYMCRLCKIILENGERLTGPNLVFLTHGAHGCIIAYHIPPNLFYVYLMLWKTM